MVCSFRYDQAGGAETVATKLSDQRGSGGGRVDRRCTVSAIKDEGLGQNGQAAFVQVSKGSPLKTPKKYMKMCGIMQLCVAVGIRTSITAETGIWRHAVHN